MQPAEKRKAASNAVSGALRKAGGGTYKAALELLEWQLTAMRGLVATRPPGLLQQAGKGGRPRKGGAAPAALSPALVLEELRRQSDADPAGSKPPGALARGLDDTRLQTALAHRLRKL